MQHQSNKMSAARSWIVIGGGTLVAVLAVLAWHYGPRSVEPMEPPRTVLKYKPRQPLDTSGFAMVESLVAPWPANATLEEISACWKKVGYKNITKLDQELRRPHLSPNAKIDILVVKAMLCCYEGDAKEALRALQQARDELDRHDSFAENFLYTVIYFQGVAALRRGEDENCIFCRGESSCILPIAPAAIHTNPTGSRLAIQYFTEYLQQFPKDLEVRWLLNVAHMTLGEHPRKVNPAYLISLDKFRRSAATMAKFRDIGHLVGVNRFDQSGGAILEDFDNDGLLDLAVTSFDATKEMGFYRNRGDGTFEDRTNAAGLRSQLGGLYCVQTDYNNDGHMDIFIPRGAWLQRPMRPSLLKNNGNGTFRDVTRKAGLLAPMNSISASWADFDNDGFLDLFVCGEHQANRLYRNRGDGTFDDVAAKAGVQGSNKMSKGAAWFDYDNDNFPDLFVNNYTGTAQLFHNLGNGTFRDVTRDMGMDGPEFGFSCWAWDYDNDGWLDVMATTYKYSLGDIVQGIMGQPFSGKSNRLYRNIKGKRFEDVTDATGLNVVFAPMGSNFGDFDNDGFLDMYLGTGAPSLDILVPNRMLKNLAGKRFVDVTAISGTGQLQKGHGVACGDWDRDGDIDIFVQMGGAINGDKYHNILFQNPGQGNNWLTVKLRGKKSNRAAIGARIKVVTEGNNPFTIHRHVSSGSSFGANPLEQTIGLGRANRIGVLEVHWPTSDTTQVFRNVAVNQFLEINEFDQQFRVVRHTPISLPK